MNLQTALFNWLQIKTVADARPDDQAARQTADFFEEILRDDHKLTNFEVVSLDATMYHLKYELNGVVKKQMFDREQVDQLLHDINAEPKYNS
jgi:hypothetical protein